MVKKYYAKKLGDSVKKIIAPIIKDPIIANIIKSWSYMPEWASSLTPSNYARQTKTLWLKTDKTANLLSLQYKSSELKDLINIQLGYIAISNVRIKYSD
ncbi:DUF721 domain-containing protein [Candidatus Cytomitobacter indipagum]|uniref:DUF721 domain-containing protein n=1 Tax=Candidatus Cytomitobacter indipagum TaxID=2601575 RepID=A0A5C0UDS5_9PROT|nr:DUF721 domain-containing protein [Candidatus Cytomitobacter indipagum]QEK38196.1 DUF721 domain-containing protein [Candidatus Cytomitobacter indipagum]